MLFILNQEQHDIKHTYIKLQAEPFHLAFLNHYKKIKATRKLFYNPFTLDIFKLNSALIIKAA